MQEEVPIRAAKVLEDGLNRKAIERDAKNLQSLGQAWQLAREVDKAIPILKRLRGWQTTERSTGAILSIS